jgi:hypothetical protein
MTKAKFNKNVHKINNYMTSGLLISRSTKIKLHKVAVKERTQQSMTHYRNFRNLYNATLRISKKMYFDKNFSLNKKNPKRTWELLKEAANLKKSNDQINSLNINNQSVSDPRLIADAFNNFFVRVGAEISESIIPTNAKAEDFMPILENIDELDLGETNPTHFLDIIKSLQAKSSLDSDGLSTKLLKKVALEISRPISHIFNLSLQQGIFPQKLKKSRTVPIFKAGNPELCDNYRPIALLSSLSKILEKMVSVKLVNHLDLNKILYKHQYGFQRGKSTEHNLIHALNFIGQAFNENKFCIGVFFDLKKAFDVCSHEILLMKLSRMGVRGAALEWFKSYLSNRTQFVDINGAHSTEKKIKISILQGSILGPILFLCYINDLHNVTDLFTLMFADDTFSTKSDNDLNRLIESVNIEINKMAIWFRANKLAVNKSKTKYIIFRTRGKKLPNIFPDLIYNENESGCPFNPDFVTTLERYHTNHVAEDKKAYKLLGILLDEHLTLDFHVNQLQKKLSRSLYCINMAKNNLNPSGLRSLYFALIHSHLSYCPIILNCMSKQNISKLEKIQKKAIRTITKSNYNAHTLPLFIANKILPFEKIVKNSKLLFMHSIYHEYAPISFHGTWQKNNERQLSQNLRNENEFTLPVPRIELFKKFPLYSLPSEWNNAGDLVFYENRVTFKHALREKLFEELLD